MAVARKIKTLLTVNILVFVGIILFSVYCRIQDRSEELVQIGRLSDQRLRGRNAKVTNSLDRQSILKRLERLEDVVYNQLNAEISTVSQIVITFAKRTKSALKSERFQGKNAAEPHPARREVTCGEYTYGLAEGAVRHMECHWGGSTQGGDTPDSDGRADSAKGRHGLTAGSWSWKNTHMGSPQGSPHMEPSLAQVTQAYEH
ncbi:hypothetical protein PO909_026407 [Leuciscus waleckii]